MTDSRTNSEKFCPTFSTAALAICPDLDTPDNKPSHPQMKTIVALLDFSDTTARILDEACARAESMEAEVVLIHVIPPPIVGLDVISAKDPTEDYLVEMDQLLGLRDSLAARGVSATAKQVQGPVLETIVDQIKKLQPVLIILGAHRHGTLHDLLVKDITKEIVDQATCGVLIVSNEGPVEDEARWNEATEQVLVDGGGFAS